MQHLIFIPQIYNKDCQHGVCVQMQVHMPQEKGEEEKSAMWTESKITENFTIQNKQLYNCLLPLIVL